MTIAQVKEELKEKTWIFSMLWSLCVEGGRATCEGTKSRNSINFQLNVPDTVIFRDGVPIQWIATGTDGFLYTKDIELLDDLKKGKISKEKREYLMGKQLKIVGQTFVKFISQFKSRTSKKSYGDQICVAWYKDGNFEVLSNEKYLRFIQHKKWRVQLVALQAYVNTKSQVVGYYYSNHSIGLREYYKIGSNQNAAINLVTKSLAVFVQRTANLQEIQNSEKKVHDNRAKKLIVINFEAKFIIDTEEQLWFSHLSKAKIKYCEDEKKKTSVKDDQKIMEEAMKAKSKLRKLLNLAFNRKITAEKCFSHFDPSMNGFVDSDGLKDGLIRLGILVSDSTIEILMNEIGSVSGLHFRCKDLASFARTETSNTGEEKNDSIEQDEIFQPILENKENGIIQFEKEWESYTKVGLSQKEVDAEVCKDIDHDTIPKAIVTASDEKKKIIKSSVESKRETNDNDKSSSQQVPKKVLDKTFSRIEFDTKQKDIISNLSNFDKSMEEGRMDDTDAQAIREKNMTNKNLKSTCFSKHGFTMHYRLISAKNERVKVKEENSTLLKKQEYEKSLSIFRRQSQLNIKKRENNVINFIVVSDLFMTFEDLDTLVNVISEKGGLILLIGLPGTVGTTWPKSSTLNNATHSDCLSDLLLHLTASGLWTPAIASPIVSIGFGIGAAALLHFVCKRVKETDLESVHSSMKNGKIFLVNGYTRCKAINSRKIKDLKSVLSVDEPSTFEILQKVSNFLFSHVFINKMGRAIFMNTVWQKERSCIFETDDKKRGIIKVFEGLQETEDITSNLSHIELPLFLIQSSLDNFFDPKDICEVFGVSSSDQNSQKKEKEGKMAHAFWIDAGHEIFLEKRDEVINIIKYQMNDIKVRIEIESTEKTLHQKRELTRKSNNNFPGVDVRTDLDNCHPQFSEESNNIVKKQKSDRKMSQKEQDRLLNEIYRMRLEDKLSLLYQRKVDTFFRRSAYDNHLRERTQNLRSSKDRIASAALHESLQKTSAFRREQNRSLYEGIREDKIELKINVQDYAIRVENSLQQFDLENLYTAVEDLIQSLQGDTEATTSMKFNQNNATNEYGIISEEKSLVEEEMRNMNRALRIRKTNGFKTNNVIQTASALDQSYKIKFEALADLKIIQKQKQDSLDYYNKNIQNFMAIIKRKHDILKLVSSRLSFEIKNYSKEIASLRQAEEDSENELKSITKRVKNLTKRRDNLNAEMKRDSDKSEAFVDTVLWQGVIQRMALSDFHFRVREEMDSIEKKLKESSIDENRRRTQAEMTKEQCRIKSNDKEKITELMEKVESFLYIEDQHTPKGRYLETINSTLKPKNKAQSIRNKNPSQRSCDEQKWISIDQLVNPSLYSKDNIEHHSLSNSFIEPTNDLRLSKENILRIISLSEQIQLALPFLKSDKEKECHRLWNTITRGYGEEYYNGLDKQRCTKRGLYYVKGVENIHIKKETQIVGVFQRLWRSYKIESKKERDLSDEEFDWKKLKCLMNTNTEKEFAQEFLSDQMQKEAKYIDMLLKKYYVSKSDLFMMKNLDSETKILTYKDAILNIGEEFDFKTSNKEIAELMTMSFISSNPVYINPWERINVMDSINFGMKKQRLKTFLKSLDYIDRKQSKIPDSYCIIKSLDDLIRADKIEQENILIDENEVIDLINKVGLSLEAKQCHCHRFSVKDCEHLELLRIHVSIVFQGYFEADSYKPAKILASMCCLPNESSNKFQIPIPLGTAPYAQQSFNTTERLGRICVHYDPQKAIKASAFEIFVKAETASKYSLKVTGEIGTSIHTELKRKLTSFCNIGEYLDCGQEIAHLLSSNIHLSERKLLLMKSLVQDAKEESVKCENDIEECDSELESAYDMTDATVASVKEEIKVLEEEYVHWCQIHSTRLQQRNDIKQGIQYLINLRRKTAEFIITSRQKLQYLKNMLPIAIAKIFGLEKAKNSMMFLGSEIDEMKRTYISSDWIENVLNEIQKQLKTPADTIRRLAKAEGFTALTLEEKQWSLIDCSLNPQKWKWRDRSDKDKDTTLLQTEPNLIPFRLDKAVIECILKKPYHQLNREEKRVRKLTKKYHDCENVAPKEETTFDIQAPLIRSKAPETWSLEELEWVSIDKILNPHTWLWLKNRPSKIHLMPRLKRKDQYDGDKIYKAGAELPLGKWTCTFNREKIIEVWKCEGTESVDELRCQRLLLKYNGQHNESESFNTNKNMEPHKITTFKKYKNILTMCNVECADSERYFRCHKILNELQETISSRNKMISSDTLHHIPQSYPREILRLELERELDRLLLNEINDSCESNEKKNVGLMLTKRKKERREMAYHGTRNLIDVQIRGKMAFMGSDTKKQNGFCLACVHKPCLWKQKLDPHNHLRRKDELTNELLFIKQNPRNEIFESIVARSALNGGSRIFKKEDLITELEAEKNNIVSQMKLNDIDKDLHDSFATRTRFLEIKSLHGYSTLLSIENARIALNREHNVLVAASVANDVINDILYWMMEGWHFGEWSAKGSIERNSGSFKHKQTIAPSLNQAARITKDAKKRLISNKESSESLQRIQNMNIIETNLKFGLFSVAFMYFRAIHLISREKCNWSTQQNQQKGVTVERKQMLHEEQQRKIRNRAMHVAMEKARIGELRKVKRKKKELLEVGLKFYRNINRRKKENIASHQIQRFYRGYIGRKVTKRWAMKKAEIGAINALMNGCAITITRIWRGYQGRIQTKKLRREMTEFIVKLRSEDVQEEVKDYWKSHSISKMKLGLFSPENF